jgi:uncharacterized protein
MRRNFKWILTGAVALAALGMISRTGAEEMSRGRTISVSGQGKVAAVPDQARLEFEVQAETVQLEEASSRAKGRMNEVLKAVKAFGIDGKDIQTVRYNVQPKYKYDKEGNENKQVGFTVSNRLRVVLKNLDLAGKVLEAVTKAGVSQIEGPSFGFADPSKLELQALKAAMEDARSKAEALAQSAGVDLGKVYSVSQSSVGMPSPRPMMAMSMMKAGGDVPIERGENEVTAQVEVVFTIK